MDNTRPTDLIPAGFNRLLETLYANVGQGVDWQAFLGDLVAATESRSARMLLTNAAANQVLASTKVNIDDGDHQRYVEHFVNTCPWRPELAHKPSGQLYSTFLDFSCRQDAFYRTEFFNDWARAQDIHHGVCGTVMLAGAHKVQLLVQRTGDQGHFSRADTHSINQFLPHLRQALRLEQLAVELGARAHASVMASELRPLPFVLLDAKGAVGYVSPRAQSLVQQSDMGVRGKQLQFQEPAVAQRFWAAFRQLREGELAEPLVMIRRQGRSPLSCLLTPVSPALADHSFWPVPAYVVVYLYDPEQVAEIDANLLMSLFQLTEGEARVARDIALGLDPQVIALRDQRSAHTVRAQLKSVFTKMRCHRQNQLAAMVLQSPAVRWI